MISLIVIDRILKHLKFDKILNLTFREIFIEKSLSSIILILNNINLMSNNET